MSNSRRSSARAVGSFVAVVLALGALFNACAETRRSLGEECIKNDDCLSNICESLHCAAAPPIGTVPSPDGAAPTPDTGTGETGSDATGDVGSDTSSPADAADGPQGRDASNDVELDAIADALADVVTDATTDAASDSGILPLDASLDALLDVNLDTGVDLDAGLPLDADDAG